MPGQGHTLSSIGEFGLIDEIRSRFSQPSAPDFGIGDDAAVLTPSAGMQILVSTDLLSEQIHFDLDFGTARLLGRKSLAVNLSDLAGMGAVPRWFFLSLSIPANLPLETIEGLLDGMAEQAKEYNCILAGGDTCGSKGGLTISITIIGEQRPELILKRSRALPDDDIWVSGSLGDSALGLQLLSQGKRINSRDDYLLLRHLDPTPRCNLGVKLAKSGLVNAMIDISDGLLADLGHICEQSRCGAEIKLENIPLSPTFIKHFNDPETIPWSMAITGGEDYELCFTTAPGNHSAIKKISKTAGIPVTVIGKVTNSRQVIACLPNGNFFRPSASGYTHF